MSSSSSSSSPRRLRVLLVLLTLALTLVFVFVTASLASVLVVVEATPTVQLEVSASSSSPSPSSFSYSVWVNGQLWLSSQALWFLVRGVVVSPSDGSLQLTAQTTDSGFDTVGDYNDIILTWATMATPVLTFQTVFRQYWSLLAVPESNPDPSNIRALVFQQVWVDGGSNTTAGNVDATISAFPAFAASNQTGVDLGYVTWAGNFLGDTYGAFSGPNSNLVMDSGMDSGPIVLYDANAMVTAMIAPFDSFMATSVVGTTASIHWGFMGGLNSIAPGTSSKVMIYFDDVGVRKTVLRWGDVMLDAYGKRRSDAQNEFIVQYLGYSTDRGAYYYTQPEPGMNFEETFAALRTYADAMDLPYKFMSIGSFWYFKDSSQMDGGGLLNWTAMPSVFPDGLQAMHENWQGPIMAHNRWFSARSPYLSINGGLYDFVISDEWALPASEMFWDDFFGNATWGIQMYIQDWLITQVDTIEQLTTDQYLGRAWLLQMGLGAARHGVNIQYCMPQPRHVLQSVEIPNVVQVRGSQDYVPGQHGYNNWQIGTNSMLEYALGMAVYKDNFWTTSVQPGNMYNSSEPKPSLQAYCALSSGGSVAPSDRIGYANVTLVRQTCRGDGKLLKPDVPAMDLDTVFAAQVWPANGPNAIVTHTYTEIAGLRWLAILTTNVSAPYKLSYDDLRLSQDVDPEQLDNGFLALRYYREYLDLSTLIPFDSAHPLILPTSSLLDFSVFYAAPIPPNGIVLLGETDKLMLMSRIRVQRLLYSSQSLVAELRGAAFEVVQMSYTLAPYKLVSTVYCALDEAGVGLLEVTASGQAMC